MNVVTISGRLGKDPELKKTQNGTSVINCSIAIDEYKKDENAPANWQQIQLWKQQAEFVYQNAEKGTKLFIVGRLQNDSWEKDGVKQYKSYVIAERVEIAPKGENKKNYDYGDGMATESIPGVKNAKAEDYESEDEDLPF